MKLHWGHNQFESREAMVTYLAKALIIGCGDCGIYINTEDVDEDTRRAFFIELAIEMQKLTGIREGIDPRLN